MHVHCKISVLSYCFVCLSVVYTCVLWSNDCKLMESRGFYWKVTQCLKVNKVKFSHTRYRALGSELISVYRQSAHKWPFKPSSPVGCLYFPAGLRSPSQAKKVTVLRSYTAWWQRHLGVNNLLRGQHWTTEGQYFSMLIEASSQYLKSYCYVNIMISRTNNGSAFFPKFPHCSLLSYKFACCVEFDYLQQRQSFERFCITT